MIFKGVGTQTVSRKVSRRGGGGGGGRPTTPTPLATGLIICDYQLHHSISITQSFLDYFCVLSAGTLTLLFWIV